MKPKEKMSQKKLSRFDVFTITEEKVLRAIALGYSNIKIARKNEVSVRTIEKHRSNIIRKLRLGRAAGSLERWILSTQEFQLDIKQILHEPISKKINKP